jgi:DNA recombination protein RmuC
MPEALIVIIAALVCLVVWFSARARADKALARGLKDAGDRASELQKGLSASEAVEAELRRRIADIEDDLAVLRAALDGEKDLRVKAETRHIEAEKNLTEQKRLLDEMDAKLAETFKSISLEALSRNSEEFLKLADKTLKSQAELGGRELEGKKELIDQSLDAISKKMHEMQKKVEEVGQGSIDKIGEVSGQIKRHHDITAQLSDTAERLRRTLASSRKRGEWGERMAEDVIRLTGMVEGINYIKQKSLEHAAGRPDYTFFLPNNLRINMDVKFPLENYRHYLEAATDHDRKRYRDELLRNAKTMIKQVTTREYIDPAGNTVDYVIVFIPNEQVYSFINESDTTIMDASLKQKVILCSPFTLYAVLAVIRQAVENFNMEKTASEILNHLEVFFKQWDAYKERFKVMGDRLDAARREYDALLSTRSNQLERPLMKIEELRKQRSISLEGDAGPGEQP